MRKERDVTLIDTLTLECLQLKMSPGFNLRKEDPQVYLNEDREGYNPKRQWPKIPLPTTTAPLADPAPATDPEKLKKALAVHHLAVDWLTSLGVDPCKDYTEKKVEYVLEAVQPKDTECPICKEPLSSGVRIKAHIRAKHMDVTEFQCKECLKSFGDNQTLTYHERSHDPATRVHVCDQCGKSYVVKSRLTEHMKVHLPENIDQPCKFCGKKIKEIKNLRAHERRCDKNKTKSKAPRVQCPFCPKYFAQAKDMRRHAKDKHPTQDPHRASK